MKEPAEVIDDLRGTKGGRVRSQGGAELAKKSGVGRGQLAVLASLC